MRIRAGADQSDLQPRILCVGRCATDQKKINSGAVDWTAPELMVNRSCISGTITLTDQNGVSCPSPATVDADTGTRVSIPTSMPSALI